MKNKIIIAFIFVLVLPICYAGLNCEVRSNSCLDNEVNLFQMTSLNRGHASVDDSGAYKVCCFSDDGDINNSCDSINSFNLLNLYLYNNSHVQIPEYDIYDIPVCLSIDDFGRNLNCEYKVNNEDCEEGYSCVATLSYLHDGQVADCENSHYANKVCCSVGEPYWCYQCGGGISNNCDREECLGLEEGCFFDSTDDNKCGSCSDVLKCEDYGSDSQTCSNDPCDIGDCSFVYKTDFWGRKIEGSCTTSKSCFFDKYGIESFAVYDESNIILNTDSSVHSFDRWPKNSELEIVIPDTYSGKMIFDSSEDQGWSFMQGSKPLDSVVFPFKYNKDTTEEELLEKCLASGIKCDIIIKLSNYAPEDFIGMRGKITNESQILGSTVAKTLSGNLIIGTSADANFPRLREDKKMSNVLQIGTEEVASNNPEVVPDDTIVGDHMCDSGEWTTRTKKLAKSLIQIPGNEDFILYCDSWEKALPYPESYDDDLVRTYMSGVSDSNVLSLVDTSQKRCPTDENLPYPCTNNYCVLRYQDKAILGTSLNVDINKDSNSLLKGFLNKKSNYCDNALGKDEFVKCSGDDSIWYNDEYDLIVYSDLGISDVKDPEENQKRGLISKSIDMLKNLFSNLFNKGKFSISSLNSEQEDMIESVGRLSKLYLLREDNNNIFGAVDLVGQGRSPLLIVSYPENVVIENVCQSIERLPTKEGRSVIDCEREGNEFHVVSEDVDAINNYWQGLTSKLRTKLS